MYDYAVYIGRFQPFHLGHASVIEHAQKLAKKVIVVIGSADAADTPKNPFSTPFVRASIQSTFPKVITTSVRDHYYNNMGWMLDVKNKVRAIANKNTEHMLNGYSVCLVGHEKDMTSEYLNWFKNWDFQSVTNFKNFNATDIRKMMFENKWPYIESAVPPEVWDKLQMWGLQGKFDNLVSPKLAELKEEYDFFYKYKKAWEAAPRVPIFQTVDSVVFQSGKVLLVRRGRRPGKGLLALPGGFLDPGERLRFAMIRELLEETQIKVPEKVLRGSIFEEKVFDHPGRSQRGRTITTAFGIKLDDSSPIPKVKGSDDAAKAEWIDIADAMDMYSEFYEDHWHILEYFVNRI